MGRRGFHGVRGVVLVVWKSEKEAGPTCFEKNGSQEGDRRKPPKRNSVEIADKMGGPENIAQIIRALLKEDN